MTFFQFLFKNPVAADPSFLKPNGKKIAGVGRVLPVPERRRGGQLRVPRVEACPVVGRAVQPRDVHQAAGDVLLGRPRAQDGQLHQRGRPHVRQGPGIHRALSLPRLQRCKSLFSDSFGSTFFFSHTSSLK